MKIKDERQDANGTPFGDLKIGDVFSWVGSLNYETKFMMRVNNGPELNMPRAVSLVTGEIFNMSIADHVQKLNAEVVIK